MKRLNFDKYTDKQVGKAILNLRAYRPSRAEMTNPNEIDDWFDRESAIKRCNFNEKQQEIIRVHYEVTGGDSIDGDYFPARVTTAKYLGFTPDQLRGKLDVIWAKIGQEYRRYEDGE